uniref:Uncharacterized protein n=1 Tax=Rhizophora mucronata TaxID=61149 RepID=A0A2P2PFC9_RHIMU
MATSFCFCHFFSFHSWLYYCYYTLLEIQNSLCFVLLCFSRGLRAFGFCFPKGNG